MKEILTIFIFCFCAFAQAQTEALPNFPALPLTDAQLDEYIRADSPERWKELSGSAKNKAVEYALKQPYEWAANWLYTHLAAEFFAEYGKDLPPALKKAMLSDLAAFSDMYETIRPEDNMPGFCGTLKTLYQIYPAQTLKYLRAAYAISLIYDVPPPSNWPDCKMPSNPAAISQPQELFWHFMEDPSVFMFPMDKLSVGELVWMMGVAGPLSELKEMLKPNTSPAVIEKAKQLIKTDYSRLKNKKFLPWDEFEHNFTLANMKKYGASNSEKMYYTWRLANANGIPCLYFCEEAKGNLEIWFAYMSKPGVWKYDIERSPEAKKLFGRPLNPQTWKTVDMYDMAMLGRRYNLTRDGVISNMFLRCSQILYDRASYFDAAILADKSKKANTENWRAYQAYIYARARGGSEPNELDALWRDSYEAFRRYPDMAVKMLKAYRNNLIMRKKSKEADRLFVAEMRGVMRNDPGFALEVYSDELNGLFARLEDKTEMFPMYLDVLRGCSSNPDACWNKITVPLASKFADNGDMRSALKTVSMYENVNGASVNSAKLREKYSPSRTLKELE